MQFAYQTNRAASWPAGCAAVRVHRDQGMGTDRRFESLAGSVQKLQSPRRWPSACGSPPSASCRSLTRMHSLMNVGELVVKALAEVGVEHLYGIPGDAINDITKAAWRISTMTTGHRNTRELPIGPGLCAWRMPWLRRAVSDQDAPAVWPGHATARELFALQSVLVDKAGPRRGIGAPDVQ